MMAKDLRAGEKVFNVSALFDLSFSQFVTISIVKLLYLVGIVLAGLLTLSFIFSSFAMDPLAGVVTLVISPLIFLIMVVLLRIYLELIIVVFRIAQNTSIMAGHGDAAELRATTMPPPPPVNA